MQQADIEMLFGLTRDSDHILLPRIALEHGYRMVYRGRHHYRPSGLTHSFAAGPDVIRSLQDSFQHGNHGQWAERLAHGAALIAQSPAAGTEAEIESSKLQAPPV